MADLLVNLLKLPQLDQHRVAIKSAGVVIRRAQPFEITPVVEFIENEFSVAWADEVSVGFSNKPVTVYLAITDSRIAGFGAYECTRRGFFGPTGVVEEMQGKGIGTAILLECLHGLREMGYVYGIIGGVGPVEFYQKSVGAIVIPDSEPGIYTDLLK
jgi:GNAT superfamily N-acetyltransferase